MPPDRTHPPEDGSSSQTSISNNSTPGSSVATHAPPAVSRKPYAKVDRSAKACQRCHSRKTRCSGTAPCQFCAGRGYECIFDDGPHTSKTPSTNNNTPKTAANNTTELNKLGESATPAGTTPSQARKNSVPSHASKLEESTGQTHQNAVILPPLQYQPDEQPNPSTSHPNVPPSHGSPPTHINSGLPIPANRHRYSLPGPGQLQHTQPSPHHHHSHSFSQSQMPSTSSNAYYREPQPPTFKSPSGGSPSTSLQGHHTPSNSMSSNHGRLPRPSPIIPPRPPHALQTLSQTSPSGTLPSPSSASTMGDRQNAGTNYPPDSDHSVSGVVLTRFQRIPARRVDEPDITRLLDKRAARAFFDAYFHHAEWIYQLWPFADVLHKQHEALWAQAERKGPPSSSDSQDAIPSGVKTTLCALLAFGAIFEHQFELSETLYRAARSAYLDILELLTIESIQLAMQMAVFEINTNRSRALWSTLADAVRIAHALNLHRRPALANKPQNEALRRTQLWWCTRVHDIWHSLSTGRPSLTAEEDIDLDVPFDAILNGRPRQVSSDLFAMRVGLSSIWTHIHDKLYRSRHSGQGHIWLHTLPELDSELHVWERDIKTLFAAIERNASRDERMAYTSILLAEMIISIIMHRSFLIQRDLEETSEGYHRQRSVSEAAILHSAIQVLELSRRLMSLGTHLSFWFIISDIQIACLALCEYIQNFVGRSGASMDVLSEPQQGLATAIGLLEEIDASGENPAVVPVLEAVRAIQQAVRPVVPQIPESHPNTTFTVGHTPSVSNQSTAIDFSGNVPLDQTLLDMDWLYSLTSSNIMDGFVASPAPAAENLAWWLNPYSA